MEKQLMPFRELLLKNRFMMNVEGPAGEVIYVKLGKNVFAKEQLAGVEMKLKPVCENGINELVVYLP